jgi:tetratricopeptide (TPR) repeat protein
VGLSKPRDRHFSGLALDERLAAKEANPRCGLMVIDLTTGSIAHWLELEGVVVELYDVQVLPGVRRPMALGFKSDEIARLVTCPGFSTFQGELSGTQNSELSSSEGGGLDGTFGTRQPNAKARKQFERGKFLSKQGSLEKAVICFQEAVRQQPDYVAAYNQLGNVLQALDKTDKAMTAYEKILQINPNVPEAHCNLGNIWQIQGKFKEAMAAYQQALQIKPNFTLAHLNLAKLLVAEGQMGDAENHYQQAQNLEPNNSEVYFHYGNCLKQQGKIEEAIDCFRAALKLQPNYVEAYHSLGQVLAKAEEK